MQSSDFDPLQQHQSVESKIVVALERISQAFRVLLWQESKEHALTPTQVQVLIFLLHHEGEKRKVSYLADEFNMTKATVSDTVKALEQKGLITKAYEPHDTRSYVIHLTEKGHEIAGQTSLFSREIRQPLDKLPMAEKERLLGNLLQVISHLNEAGVITIQRMCATCAYYERADGQHYCKLLNQVLQTADLRVDCPEHQLAL